MVTVHQRPQCFLSAWLPFCAICGIPFSPSILVFGSGDSGSVTLLPTLFSEACAASTRLGLVQGVDSSSLTCLWAFVSGFFPRSHAEDFCFYWHWLLPRELVSCRLCLPSSPLLVKMACLSYIPQFVAKSESLTRSIPRSFLVKSLADFAAGLDTDLLLCPVRALRLYLLRARSLSPGRLRLFVSPRRPSRAMSKNAVSFFLREVISAAGAARPQVGFLRAHEVRSVWNLSRSTVTGRLPLSLSQPLGPPVRCSHLFIFATSNTNMMACFLWVLSWLRVLG